MLLGSLAGLITKLMLRQINRGKTNLIIYLWGPTKTMRPKEKSGS